MSRSVRNVLIVLLGLGIFALAIFLALPPRLPPPAPLPNPNGYDVLVKAGNMIDMGSKDLDKINPEELQAVVLSNAAALKLARSGLTLDCRAPPMVLREDGTAPHLNDVSKFKRLTQAFSAEGRLAELENRSADAATAYLDTMQLGRESCRGGLLIDALVGIAIEAIGTAQMEKLIPSLDANRCREAAAALEAAEPRRESVASVLQQERDWARRNYGLKGEIARLITYKSIRQSENTFTAKSKAQATRTRNLMVKLAARAYELEHGNRPQTFADLVPAYLKAVPLDPATGTNMVYLPR